jgi:hypothetical protein
VSFPDRRVSDPAHDDVDSSVAHEALVTAFRHDPDRLRDALVPYLPTLAGRRYDVEYAHIYSDRLLSPEQLHGAAAAAGAAALLATGGASCTRTVLIDDYARLRLLETDVLVDSLSAFGVRPDYLASEAALVELHDEFVGLITDKDQRRSIKRYYRDRGYLPCSYLVAIWYLVRLGALDPGDVTVFTAVDGDAGFSPADQLVNVLHPRFRIVEGQAHRLIGATRHAALLDRMHPVFLDDVAAELVPHIVH